MRKRVKSSSEPLTVRQTTKRISRANNNIVAPQSDAKNHVPMALKSAAIYDKGANFVRLPSGRVNVNVRSDSIDSTQMFTGRSFDQSRRSFDQSICVKKLAKEELAKKRGSGSGSGNGSLAPSIQLSKSSSEILMCKHSFQSQQSKQTPQTSNQVICLPNQHHRQSSDANHKNIVMHTPRKSSSCFEIGNGNDRVLSYLTGNYAGDDKIRFAVEIIRQVQDLSTFSTTESIIEFLSSKEYQYWIGNKTKEWNKNNPSTKIPQRNSGSRTSQTSNDSGKMPSSSFSQKLVQIFQNNNGGEPCIGVQNHYNYDININTNERYRSKKLLSSRCGKMCCVLL